MLRSEFYSWDSLAINSNLVLFDQNWRNWLSVSTTSQDHRHSPVPLKQLKECQLSQASHCTRLSTKIWLEWSHSCYSRYKTNPSQSAVWCDWQSAYYCLLTLQETSDQHPGTGPRLMWHWSISSWTLTSYNHNMYRYSVANRLISSKYTKWKCSWTF